MDVASFEEIREDFEARVRRIVWAQMATVDRQGRPRLRIIHPVWEGTTAWITTRLGSHKSKHLARNPFVSLGYWDMQFQVVYADCRAEWVDDEAEKLRVWDYIKAIPEPYGFDPAITWADGPSNPEYGLLRLTPWRIEVSGIGASGRMESRVWRQDVEG